MLPSSSTAACCSLLALLAPTLAHAQSGESAAAEALFRRGREAMEAKNYREACPSFEESQRLDPAAGTLMNLATCEEKLGRLASAWQHWREAMDALGAADDRVPFAQRRVDDLEKKLPRLGIRLKSGKEQGARVVRDDIELGPASHGLPLPVDPGPHTVTVHMQGHLAEQVVVSLAEGEQKLIDVHPGAVDASTPELNSSTQIKSWPRTLGWVLGGVGVAGVGTAAVTGVLLLDYKSTVERNCPNSVCLNQEGLDAAASGRTFMAVNTGAWIAGAVGLGVGAYLVLSTARNQAGVTAIAPSVSRDAVSVFCRGTF